MTIINTNSKDTREAFETVLRAEQLWQKHHRQVFVENRPKPDYSKDHRTRPINNSPETKRGVGPENPYSREQCAKENKMLHLWRITQVI